ncbi:alpha,alpha-trehalase TreA [Mucilaginibacter sp. RS28]|uniref:Alpha,alpha-trehalase TreA n=1 Tax=Mucilaginibacter straminoryzae TaxID=2932774 RepID=A0A9X2BCS4_9SPHI|nr:alpha,alpha-trehalase TreA [Mucilaginibacter straminoryzae]MCJ8211292.1 alpha,alpha-trehalase TreA [Mucilaginibacter straminoryzae]
MRRYTFFALLLLEGTTVFAQVKTPPQLYPGLFEAVQMGKIYADGKTFADATPRRSPELIMKDYNQQKSKPGFNLKAFAEKNFIIPAPSGIHYKSNISSGIRKHIDTLWTVLQHKADTVRGTSLLPLPYPYIVPGGRFREIYYWDSYFTMLGLEESKRFDIMENMIRNFAYLIDTYGHIPNGNRSYYLSRSQPPFFAAMVQLLAKHKGDQTYVRFRPQLLKEYAFWMKGTAAAKPGKPAEHVVIMPDGSLLNRYCDAGTNPREESYREDVLSAQQSKQTKAHFYQNLRSTAESGWDFSSRWFADNKRLTTLQTTSLVPPDLNSLLYNLERVIAKSYQISGDGRSAQTFEAKAKKRKDAIQKYLWNASLSAFADYNWETNKLSNQLTIATASPLYFFVATDTQAPKIATTIKTKLLRPGGVACTMYDTGEQWDRPNGWAPLEWLTIGGLRNYQQNELAKDIAMRWMKINIENFKKNGKLAEKYDIENLNARAGGGEYPTQDGFGWTNGVLLKLINLYGVK